jgi:hypothetical protein
MKRVSCGGVEWRGHVCTCKIQRGTSAGLSRTPL